MSIQLADRSIKCPIGVCENLLVKVGKFIFLVDFVVLEMDEDELVSIILGRPFLAMARAVIDVHEGKLSLRVMDIQEKDKKLKPKRQNRARERKDREKSKRQSKSTKVKKLKSTPDEALERASKTEPENLNC
ncbi:DNA-directed DNA polymerase [Tanacetum coccineum]